MPRNVFIWFGALLVLATVPQLVHAATVGFMGPILPDICNCLKGQANAVTQNSAPAWGCFLQTIQNVINFAVSFGVIIITLYIAWAGFGYMMAAAGGSEEARSKGNKRITNAVLGLMILLSAWLLVDFVMKVIYNPNATGQGLTSQLGPWNSILGAGGATDCLAVNNPTVGSAVAGAVTGTATPQSPTVSTGSTNNSCQPSLAQKAQQYNSQVCAAASANGIPGQCNQLMGILAAETGGCTNNVISSTGAAGCMQIMPSTARTLDPGDFANSSDSQIQQQLQSNNTLSIQLGAKYYAQLYNQFNGNSDNATAAYNAGTGTVSVSGLKGPFAQSTDCPGEYAWQCTVNPGGFTETQREVTVADSVSATIGGTCH